MPLLVLRETRSQRILEVAHEPAGLDRQALQAVFQHLQVDAVARVQRNLHRFELQAFEYLQAGIEGRRFDGHQVAGAGNHLQAEVEGFQGAVADHQLLDGQRQAADHVAQGDLPAQGMVARCHVGHSGARVHLPDRMGHGARQALQGKEFRAGKGRAEGHCVRVLDGAQHREHQFADIHLGGGRFPWPRPGFGQGAAHVFADEVAGARAGDDQSAAFQQVISLEHGGSADAVGAAGVPHRGHLLPRGQHPGADQFGDLVGEFLVALHFFLAGQRQGGAQL
ncbi:hypothetical protein D9M71_511890 [compost metagenome]